MKPLPLSLDQRYKLHVSEWKDCNRCELALTRGRVVIGRGALPADIVFIGEAPGASENVVGIPFVGPAGKLFDQIITRAIPDGAFTYAITNLVGCIPRNDEGNKIGQPDADHIEACSSRLKEFVEMANPKLIVRVGKLATDFTQPMYKHTVKFKSGIRMASIDHPAHILRMTIAQQGMATQRAVVVIKNALEELGEGVTDSDIPF